MATSKKKTAAKKGGAPRAGGKKSAPEPEPEAADRQREHTADLSMDSTGNVRGRIPGRMLKEVLARDGDEAVWQPNPDGYTWTFFVRAQGPRRKRVSE
jgi:hypothetical protein